MSLLPTATYGGATEPLYAPAGSVKTAAGPAGAVQYTDGAGNFLGNDGLVYDGVSKLENTPSGNSLDLNNAGGVVLTANTLALDIAGTPGTAGYVLTSDGDVASWQPSGGGGGVPNTWALYPATNNVNIANFNITNANRIETGSLITPGIGSSAVGPGPGIICSSDFIMPTSALEVGNIDMTVGAGLGNITNVTSIAGPIPGGGVLPNLTVDGNLTVSDELTINGVKLSGNTAIAPTLTIDGRLTLDSIGGRTTGPPAPALLSVTTLTSFTGNNITEVASIGGIAPPGGGPAELGVGSTLNLQGNEISNIGIISGVPPALGAPGTILVNANLNMAGRFIREVQVLSGVVAVPGQPVTINLNATVLTNLSGILGTPGPLGLPRINAYSSLIDNLAGIGGPPSGPGGVGQITFNRSEILDVASIQGVAPQFVPGPRVLTIDGDIDLTNNNSIVNCQSISSSLVDTVDLVLNNAVAPAPVSLTISPNGTILKDLIPLIYTGLARPAVGDLGLSTFTVAVPSVTANSIVIATIQVPDQPGDQTVWLINTVPGPGTLTFNLAAPITAGSQLTISWLVTQL